MVSALDGYLTIPAEDATTAQALKWLDWSGYSCQEIADELGVKRTAVKAAIKRLRAQGFEFDLRKGRGDDDDVP